MPGKPRPQTTEQIRLIITDVGGVLCDFKKEDLYTYLSERFGISYAKVFEELDPSIVKMENGGITLRELSREARRRLGVSDAGIYWSRICKKAGINRRVLELYKPLRHSYKIAVLTNAGVLECRVNRRKLSYSTNFDKIFASYYTHVEKPKAAAFKIVLDYFHAKPQETVFIDDKTANLDGARRTGIKTILFTNYAGLVRDLHKLGID